MKKPNFKRLLALQASAGSGKTFALSVRFVALILQKQNGQFSQNISNILAITFTNKAANEMKSNIIETFLNMDANEPGISAKESKKRHDRVNAIADLLGVDYDDVLALSQERRSDFLNSELKIYTFDAFFSQILRRFSLNVGLMPDFKIQNNIDEIINIKFINALSPDELKELSLYLSTSDFSAYSFLENLASNPGLCLPYPPSPKANNSDVLVHFDELKKQAIVKGLIPQRSLNKFEISSVKEIATLMASKTKYIEKIQSELNAIYDDLYQALKKYYKAYEAYKISHFLRLVNKYSHVRAQTISELGELDFKDVSANVYKLLKMGEQKFDVNELYFRLDARISDILIDEFQDTNIEQYEILLPLIEEIISGLGQNEHIGSFFYVGDIKQSIYRFRGGDKKIFDFLIEKFTKNGIRQIQKDSLDINYRSTKKIVEFVNQTFKDKISNYQAQKPNSQDDGLVDVSSFDSNDLDSFLTLLASKVNFILDNKIPPNQITILCWQNKDINIIKEYLQSQNIKVASRAKYLINDISVSLVLEYLKFCIFGRSYHGRYLYEYLGQNFAPIKINFDDNASILKLLASRLGLNIYSKNLLKLYEISQNYPNIIDFIYEMQNCNELSLDYEEDGINITTVHKSKGLGFACCIVCDNLSGLNRNNSAFLSDFDLYKNRWEIKLNDKILEFLGDDDFIKLKQNDEILEKQERINALYVALTRAKSNLFILCANNASANKPSYFKAYGKDGENEILNLSDLTQGSLHNLLTNQAQNTLEECQIPPFAKIKSQDIKSEPKANNIDPKTAYFGMALHYLLEMSADFSYECLERAMQALINVYGYNLTKHDLANIKQRAKHFIDAFNENFKHYKICLKEQTLSFEGEILRLDLLLLDEQSAVVIDYKSSLANLEKNKEQVNKYMRAIKHIYAKQSTKGLIAVLGEQKCELINV